MGRLYVGRSSGECLTATNVCACLFLLFGSFRPEAKLTLGNLQLHPHCLLNSDKVTCQRKKLHSTLSFCCFPSRSLCSSQLPGCLAFKQMAPIKVTASIWVATALWSHWAEVGRRLAKLFQAVVSVSGSQKRNCRWVFSLFFHVLRALD